MREQSFPRSPVTWHLRKGSAITVLARTCAHHVPSGPCPERLSHLVFKRLNCSQSRAGAWNVFPDNFQRSCRVEVLLPQLCDAYVRACNIQYLFLWSTKRNRRLNSLLKAQQPLEGMSIPSSHIPVPKAFKVHCFLLIIKGVHNDEPSCKRLHSVKLRQINSILVLKIFGGFKHLTPLLNIQKLFYIFLGWKHFFFSGKLSLSLLACFEKKPQTSSWHHLRLKWWKLVNCLTKSID